MPRCGNEGNRIRRAGMLSAAASNSNYGGAGLLRPHLGDPVTGLAPFWGSHLILLFTLPVSGRAAARGVIQRLPQPEPPGPAPAHPWAARPREIRPAFGCTPFSLHFLFFTLSPLG